MLMSEAIPLFTSYAFVTWMMKPLSLLRALGSLNSIYRLVCVVEMQCTFRDVATEVLRTF